MSAPLSAESAWRRSRIAALVAQPAAGADWSLAIPSGHVYRLLAVMATLVTSAAVATRIPRLVVSDGNTRLIDVPPFATQAASLTRRYLYLPQCSAFATGNGVLSPLPDISLQAAWTIGTLTDAIDAADQWSSIVLHVIDTTVRAGAVDLDGLPDLIVEIVEAGPGSSVV